MLSNMASSLLIHKRITTTVAKAKELRKYVEPLITRAKQDTTHTRRVAFSYLQDKESVKALFNEVAEKAAERPGGYTRIIKMGARQGDNAQMCLIELVDFNELLLEEKADKKGKTRRGRRGKSKKDETAKSETKIAEADAEVEAKEEEKVVEGEAEPGDVNAETEEEKPEAEAKTEEVTDETVEVPEAETDEPEKPAEEEEKKKDGKSNE